MTVADILAALALPPESRVERRVPKTLLVENGAPTAADKRRINEGLEELHWLAALKPSNIGVPEYRNTAREVVEIAVLSAELRPAGKAPRLIELIHRAIPYPVVLMSIQAGALTLSLASKRFAQNEAGSVVVDGDVTVATLASSALLPHLSLASQPRAHMLALYQGWLACLEGIQAAAITGRFVAAASVEAAAVRRTALADHARLTREIAALRAEGDRESQMSRRVEINLEIKRLDAALAQATANMTH
jgi:hypothetical protein